MYCLNFEVHCIIWDVDTESPWDWGFQEAFKCFNWVYIGFWKVLLLTGGKYSGSYFHWNRTSGFFSFFDSCMLHIEIFVANRRPSEIFVSLGHFQVLEVWFQKELIPYIGIGCRFKNGYTSLSRDHITCSPIMIFWPCISRGRTDVRMVCNAKDLPKTKYPRVCIYLIIGN